jgi:drug/metabolite transporter (DMT)-like permease
LLLFFRALAMGAMARASPLTATAAAALSVLVGLSLGQRPTPAAWVGMAMGVIAVLLVTRTGSRNESHALATLTAIAAGIAFGFIFVAMSRTAAASGFSPLAAARATSLVVLVPALMGSRPRMHGGLILAIASGVLDMTANLASLVALWGGPLGPIAMLLSPYPTATIAFSPVGLRERMRAAQWAGAALALGAVALIAS